MNDKIRNGLASQGLEILKQAVLLALYEASSTALNFDQIHEAIGIERFRPSDGYNDYLIHGVLLRLRDEGLARHWQDEDAVYGKRRGEWEITEEGVNFIKGSF